MSVVSGNSATITFGTSTFTPIVVSIDGLEETLEALQDSDLSTTNTHTYVAADLRELAPLSATIRWEQNDLPPIAGVSETITITYARESGESTPATLAGTGFLTSRRSPDLANDTIAEGTITIQYDGKTAPTYTPGS